MDDTLYDSFWPAFGIKSLRYERKTDSLYSPIFPSIVWYAAGRFDPYQEAQCLKISSFAYQAPEPHEPPGPSDSHNASHPCGIYSYYSVASCAERENDAPTVNWKNELYASGVLVVLQCWGQVWAHEDDSDGIRSKYAKIVGIVRPPEAQPAGANHRRYTMRVTPEKEAQREETLRVVKEQSDALQLEIEGVALTMGVPLIERDEADAFAATMGVDLSPSAQKKRPK